MSAPRPYQTQLLQYLHNGQAFQRRFNTRTAQRHCRYYYEQEDDRDRIMNFLSGRRFLFVSGNMSADMDSLVSSLILAYSWTRMVWRKEQELPLGEYGVSIADLNPQRAHHLPIPLLPIKDRDVDLRRDFPIALSAIGITPNDIVTMEDVSSPPNTAYHVLVDHNVVGKPFDIKKISNRTFGVIDHHQGDPANVDWSVYNTIEIGDFDGLESETKLTFEQCKDRAVRLVIKRPSVFKDAGSCTSLVIEWLFQNALWPVNIESCHDEDERIEFSDFAKFALSAVLLDTSNMTSKVQEVDKWAYTYLTTMAKHSEPEFDPTAWFDELHAAKTDTKGFTVNMLLRKDFKSVTTHHDTTYGFSSLGFSLKSLAALAGEEQGGTETPMYDDLASSLSELMKEEKLAMLIVTAHYADPSSPTGHSRELLCFKTVSPSAVSTMKWFIDEQQEILNQHLEKDNPEFLDLATFDDYQPPGLAKDMPRRVPFGEAVVHSWTEPGSQATMWLWKQRNSAASRKQVLPLFERAANWNPKYKPQKEKKGGS